MSKYLTNSLNCSLLLIIFCSFFSCTKEHLEPDTPPGATPEPLIYISAFLDNDSIYFAGGVNSYVGITSVSDTFTHRTFNFTLQNSLDPSHSYFRISINNFQNMLGDLQNDLDSSIYSGERHYQFYSDTFSPLGATLTWVDSLGVTFSSSFIHQTHLFSIIDAADVVFNNIEYKKTSVEFDCLIASDHDTLHITNGKATILFSVN
jgi:hypothetical protein